MATVEPAGLREEGFAGGNEAQCKTCAILCLSFNSSFARSLGAGNDCQRKNTIASVTRQLIPRCRVDGATGSREDCGKL